MNTSIIPLADILSLLSIHITIGICLAWHFVRSNRRIRKRTKLYNDWWSARQVRMAWREEQRNLAPNYFNEPQYQMMWNREIFFEAMMLMANLTTVELSFTEYRKERADQIGRGHYID